MALPTEPGIKRRGTVPQKFISGTIGASPWRVKRTDRLPRWNSACNEARPNAGHTDPGTVIGSHKRHGTDGGESSAPETTRTVIHRSPRKGKRWTRAEKRAARP